MAPEKITETQVVKGNSFHLHPKFFEQLEEWWINTAYLEYRDPVVVFSSPGLLFPPKKFANLDDQLDTAAKLAIAAVSYKALIDK